MSTALAFPGSAGFSKMAIQNGSAATGSSACAAQQRGPFLYQASAVRSMPTSAGTCAAAKFSVYGIIAQARQFCHRQNRKMRVKKTREKERKQKHTRAMQDFFKNPAKTA